MSIKDLDIPQGPLGVPYGVLPEQCERKYDHIQVKDVHYQFDDQRTCKTYQGILENTSMSQR